MILVFVLGVDDGDHNVMDIDDVMDKVYNTLHTMTEHMTEFINGLGVVAQAPPDVLTLLNCVNILLSQAVQHLN